MTRKEQYNQLILQIAGLIKDETNLVGILANVSAALHDTFPERFFWVGFYLQENGNMLRLGPFQGSVACYVIPFGKGVCGKAWEEGCTLIVPDVEKFLDTLLVVVFPAARLLFQCMMTHILSVVYLTLIVPSSTTSTKTIKKVWNVSSNY